MGHLRSHVMNSVSLGQMHDKPKRGNTEILISVGIGWVQYSGEFYM
uniref:Uncharacterized protein n=1 Tax=Coturnix japonica TaxID=93934 RepID=A0A8C2U543_COTJA